MHMHYIHNFRIKFCELQHQMLALVASILFQISFLSCLCNKNWAQTETHNPAV